MRKCTHGLKAITSSRLADGTSYVTSMNATHKEARDYFVGREINTGGGEHDRMVRVIAVRQVITERMRIDNQMEQFTEQDIATAQTL